MRAKSLRLILSACLAAAWPAAFSARAGAALSCEAIPELVGVYLKNHVRHRALTPELERRTIDAYLRRLDPSRAVLLEGETEHIRASLTGIFGEIRSGDCTRLTKLHHTLLGHQREVEKFVREFVSGDDYEIDRTVTLVLDPDKRVRPATKVAREELLRSLVHFQMSTYLSDETPVDEAKDRLIHRYELRTKRMAELEPDDLYTSFLDAFATSLDPHSSYLSAEVLEDFQIGMSLSLEGIGVALSERDGYAVVERIIPGGAADRHKGLALKDKIIAVSQEGGEPVNIIDMPLREAVKLIRGKKGTEVRLTVLRQSEKTERFQITIVRDKIDLAEQAATLRFEEREVDGRVLKLAILELSSFYGDSDPGERQSTADTAKLLREVRKEKADGLLLDLSRNGGGLLEHSITISGFFLRRGDIVGVENAQSQKQTIADRDESVLYSGPMVVHTSRVSASAAEILAGALKDYRRAVIAGDDHTFGKGTVQTVSALPPGQGALKITTATFFRPGGKSTQHEGVEADVVIPSLLSGDDFGEKNQRYSLLSQRTEPFLSGPTHTNGLTARWRPVTREVLDELAKRSRGRIEVSEAFAEIREKLEEARANEGMIRLSEILKKQEEAREDAAEDKAADPADAGAPGTPETATPQVEEAISVLADLVALTH
jgi:carboxyl-terminal processing protease